MCAWRNLTVSAALVSVLLGSSTQFAAADALSIYEIQSNTTDGDASFYDYDVVDCVGGIVVAKFDGYRPRLVLQDPNYPDGWGAIQVKDWITADGFAMFNDAEVGDWIEFTNMLVEEFRGTTILQRQTAYNPTYNIVSQQNPLPPPVLVPMSGLLAPVYDPVEEGWFVENHDAELYESMRIIVRDITVGTMNLGKDADNYHVENPAEDSCWSSDYMNEDVVGLYHPFVVSGQHFCALAGVFEQYTKLSTGFDYYQVLTQTSVDLAICGDGDSDGEIALTDVPRLGECMTGPVCDDEPEGCDPPAWTSPPVNLDIQHCLMMDLDYDGDVDLGDFSALQAAWPVP